MFTGPDIVAALVEVGVTHVIWIPDSVTGPWENSIESSPQLKLIRVCREGEAWPLAAGLWLGGQTPLVLMQCTGLFESGDALRNVFFDLGLPLLAIIGVRNALAPNSRDSARRFARPILSAWGLDAMWIETPEDRPKLAAHLLASRRDNRPAIALLAEGPA